jgi:hypothetical protein
MSVAGILSTSLFGGQGVALPHNSNGVGPFKQQFQQLGQDLKSGNLTAAQTDYANLRHSLRDGTHGSEASSATETGTSTTASTPESANTLMLRQMSQALQAGNISAAQQAYNSFRMGGQSLAI